MPVPSVGLIQFTQEGRASACSPFESGGVYRGGADYGRAF